MNQTKSIPSTLTVSQVSMLRLKDFLALTKPKVVLLLILTAVAGMALAPTAFDQAGLILIASIGIGMLSGAAAAINHLLEDEIDAKMARTKHRPIASGRLTRRQALAFAMIVATSGFFLLATFVNWLTAWLTLACLFGYAIVYTVFLKRATPQNIVIGGLAGAMPPLLGWTAMTNTIDPHALLLVMIIFTWTPPHFWALAIHRKSDYEKAKIPMLPVTHGIEFTKTLVLLYTVLLLIVCLLPYLVGMSHELYLVFSLAFNLGFIYYALRLKYNPAEKTAWDTFKFSILHLTVLFIVLIIDHSLYT
ncbi:heme o synthase [Algicola sagamiensis]|uniref:heme o synthase n=1 Tax=Algicola sagamiensis TaxID=163869 RepID=UPI0003792C06|nr:heme o synthase [Algicola sagamiensis]